jgi:hypothetical protein
MKGIYLSANIGDDERVGIDFIFPGQEEVFADWFTGEIRLPTGDRLEYHHMGFASIFEKDRFLSFENGVLVEDRVVDNTLNFIPGEKDRKLNELIDRFNESQRPKRKAKLPLWKRVFGIK